MNKTAYFYWDGEMPYLNALTLDSFHKFNPDWKVVLWVGENVDYRPSWCEIREAKTLGFPKSRSVANQADLCKWYSLAYEGGLASDMDILYVKPIPEYVSVDVGLMEYGNGKTKKPLWTVGFMSGGPNAFYKDCFNRAYKNIGHQYQCTGALILRGVPKKDITFFNSDMIYPIYKHLKDRHMGRGVMIQYQIDFELPSNTIGYHWYGGGRASMKKAKTIGPDYNEPNVIKRCLDAIL